MGVRALGLSLLLANNEAWAKARLAEDPAFFTKLSQGQDPEYLYLGCSDSRVTAEEILGLKPGEAFVHRNVANQVVPTDNNVNAVIQFAVEQLKVKHILVCGHYGCGGVKAALNPSDMGQLNSWLQTLRDVWRWHQAELDLLEEPTARFDRLVELNVLEQCFNVIKIDHVQRSWYQRGYPRVHGLIFDLRSGLVKRMAFDVDRAFASIRGIYDLQPLDKALSPAPPSRAPFPNPPGPPTRARNAQPQGPPLE